uniref:Uncharacterized protein n=1 Tax=Romanomermis culicivorax TaxID=13658 RepID=A0A915LEB3_ROMCU
MRSNHLFVSQSVAAHLGIEIANEDLEIVVGNVVQNILQLVVEIVFHHIFHTIHWRIDLYNSCFCMTISEVGCDDSIADGLPTDEGSCHLLAQNESSPMFVLYFVAQVQYRLAIANNAAIFCPPDLANPKDIESIIVEFFQELCQSSALI